LIGSGFELPSNIKSEKQVVLKPPRFLSVYVLMLLFWFVVNLLIMWISYLNQNLFTYVTVCFICGGIGGWWFTKHPTGLSDGWQRVNSLVFFFVLFFLVAVSLWIAGEPLLSWIILNPPGDPTWLNFVLYSLIPILAIAFAFLNSELWRQLLADAILDIPDTLRKSNLGERGYEEMLLIKPREAVEPIIQLFLRGHFTSVVLQSWVQIESVVNDLYRVGKPELSSGKGSKSKLRYYQLNVGLATDKKGEKMDTNSLYALRSKLVHSSSKATYKQALNSMLILRGVIRKLNRVIRMQYNFKTEEAYFLFGLFDE
jgi:hypothetical protein